MNTKKPLFLALLLTCAPARGGAPRNAAATPLRVSGNHRFLVHADGAPFFPIADTAWELAWRLDRREAARYLHRRAEQRFNTIALVAFPGEPKGGRANRQGDHPFALRHGRYDPLRPLVTPGHRPDHPDEYDYWDHLQYLLDTARAEGLYVILLPTWGNCVAGDWGTGAPSDEIIFTPETARRYGEWIGRRFRRQANLLWMVGGDRNAVYGARDYRPVFRALAEGITLGVGGLKDGRPNYDAVLISYHPRKWQPNSSAWFHRDPWLAFNSIQDQPRDQVPAIEHDYALQPPKPTWLFEGGYEHRRGGYGPWQIRYQSYQTVFAGGFGVTYGNMYIYYFPRSSRDTKQEVEGSAQRVRNWETALDDPGGQQMRHLRALMESLTPAQFLGRVPDQALIAGDPGGVHDGEGLRSDRLQATRGARGDYALIYSANGRDIPVRMERLAGPVLSAAWFNPRNGRWRIGERETDEPVPFLDRIPGGPGAPVHVFDPPGVAAPGNDWVLVLRAPK
jgi:hypothetical protein